MEIDNDDFHGANDENYDLGPPDAVLPFLDFEMHESDSANGTGTDGGGDSDEKEIPPVWYLEQLLWEEREARGQDSPDFDSYSDSDGEIFDRNGPSNVVDSSDENGEIFDRNGPRNVMDSSDEDANRSPSPENEISPSSSSESEKGSSSSRKDQVSAPSSPDEHANLPRAFNDGLFRPYEHILSSSGISSDNSSGTSSDETDIERPPEKTNAEKLKEFMALEWDIGTEIYIKAANSHFEEENYLELHLKQMLEENPVTKEYHANKARSHSSSDESQSLSSELRSSSDETTTDGERNSSKDRLINRSLNDKSIESRHKKKVQRRRNAHSIIFLRERILYYHMRMEWMKELLLQENEYKDIDTSSVDKEGLFENDEMEVEGMDDEEEIDEEEEEEGEEEIEYEEEVDNDDDDRLVIDEEEEAEEEEESDDDDDNPAKRHKPEQHHEPEQNLLQRVSPYTIEMLCGNSCSPTKLAKRSVVSPTNSVLSSSSDESTVKNWQLPEIASQLPSPPENLQPSRTPSPPSSPSPPKKSPSPPLSSEEEEMNEIYMNRYVQF